MSDFLEQEKILEFLEKLENRIRRKEVNVFEIIYYPILSEVPNCYGIVEEHYVIKLKPTTFTFSV